MHAEVAEEFVSYNNRVILAGDAAHRFPPAGGFGELYVLFIKVLVSQCISDDLVLAS